VFQENHEAKMKKAVWYSPKRNELFVAVPLSYDFYDAGCYWFERMINGKTPDLCAMIGWFE